MDIYISPSRASGSVSAPPSKSIAHRLLILAAFSEGVSQISNLAMSDISAVKDNSELYIVTDSSGETAYLSKTEPTAVLTADVAGADTAVTSTNFRDHFQKFPFCPTAGNYYKVEVDLDETKSVGETGSAIVKVTCFALTSDEAHN